MDKIKMLIEVVKEKDIPNTRHSIYLYKEGTKPSKKLGSMTQLETRTTQDSH